MAALVTIYSMKRDVVDWIWVAGMMKAVIRFLPHWPSTETKLTSRKRN